MTIKTETEVRESSKNSVKGAKKNAQLGEKCKQNEMKRKGEGQVEKTEREEEETAQ